MSAVHSFPERHRAIVDSLGKRLEAFLDDPDADNLHDLRTEIRRACATLDALPKKLRGRRKTRRLWDMLRDLMRRSAKPRDLDTLMARLAGYPSNHELDRLLKQVERGRRRKLKSTVSLAASIRKLSALRPNAKETREEKEIGRRLDKVARKLRSRMSQKLPIVLAEPGNVAMLHSLRKDCKRLRYMLELMPTHRENARLAETMKSWQSLLGEVRDGDVTIEYLEGLERSPAVDEMLKAERSRRRRDYERFARACRETSGARLLFIS